MNIYIERLNTTGIWYAAVKKQTDVVESHEICTMVMNRTGIGRRELEAVLDALADSVESVLAEGNVAKVHHFLTFTPTYQLKRKLTGEYHEVLEQSKTLKDTDISASAKVQMDIGYTRELARRMKAHALGDK